MDMANRIAELEKALAAALSAKRRDDGYTFSPAAFARLPLTLKVTIEGDGLEPMVLEAKRRSGPAAFKGGKVGYNLTGKLQALGVKLQASGNFIAIHSGGAGGAATDGIPASSIPSCVD